MHFRSNIVLLVVGSFLFCGCGAPPNPDGDPIVSMPPPTSPPPPPPPPPLDPNWVIPGIVEKTRFEQTTFSAHLGEIAVLDKYVYVANSFDGFAAYELGAEGQLAITLDKPADPIPRCTTLAVHAPSATLYCGSDRSDSIAAYDVTSPEAPKLRNAEALVGPGLFVRDIFVDGDTLWLARFDDGLWTARINADGSLSDLVRLDIAGNMRFIARSSEYTLVATSDPSLLFLDTSQGKPIEVAGLGLLGPALDLAAHDTHVAIALGSQGAQYMSLAASIVRMEVHPPGVVVAADVDPQGKWLAATTFDGTYVYELTERPPRLAGYVQNNAVGTDVAFVQGDLLVSDFFYLNRHFLRPGGHVTQLSTTRGAYIPEGQPARIPLQNPGEVPLLATFRDTGGKYITEQLVPPRQTIAFELPWSTYAPLLDSTIPTTQLRVETSYPADLNSETPSWKLNPKESIVALLVRPANANPAQSGHPAPGDVFPEVWTTVSNAVSILPPKATKSRIIFYSTDCIAMWPEIEDAAWLARRGELDGGATPIFLSVENAVGMNFPKRFGVDDFTFGQYGPYGLPEVAAQNSTYGASLYDDGFWLGRIVAGASHPTDYLVDENAVVQAVEREYRGAFPLR